MIESKSPEIFNFEQQKVRSSGIIEFRINYCLRKVKNYRTKAKNSRENARKYTYNARYHHKKAIEYDQEADEWQKGVNGLKDR